MKAILEFNLPEENNEHTLAIHGKDFFCTLWDIHQNLRALCGEEKGASYDEICSMLDNIYETPGFNEVD